jgi:hypothetical protein
MSIQITSRNYAPRNHSGGNNFYLTNSGQRIVEKVEFVVDFDFTSSAANQIIFLNLFQIQVIGKTWGELGYVIGDTIALTGTINNTSGSATYSATSYTISDISNDILTVSTTLDPTSSGYIVGQLMPFNNGANSNTPLLIANSTRTAPEAIEILHNFIPNNANGGSASLIDSEVNRFRAIDVSAIAVSGSQSMVQLGNKSGGTYTSATLTRLADVSGKRKFRYELTYFFPYKFIDSTFDKPAIFANIGSIKPWFNILCIPEENNPNSALTITYSGQQGNAGWLDENYNQGVNTFTISDVTLTDTDSNPLTEIDYNQNTNFSITITGAANFLDRAEVEFYIIPPVNDYKNKPDTNGKLIHLVNAYWNGTTVTVTQLGEVDIDNLAVSVATTNTIIISGQIVPSADFKTYIASLSPDERRYRLTPTVESTGGDANENNSVTLNAKEGLLEKAPIIGGVYENLTSQVFYNHSQAKTGIATSDYVGCTEDDFLYRSLFNLDSTEIYKNLTVNMQVVRDSDGQFFDIFERLINFGGYVTTPDGKQQINYTEQLQQFLDSTDRNVISLKLTGTESGDLYELELLWSIMASWRYWIAQNNALVDFFDSTLPNNGLNNEWMRYLREAGFSLRLRCTLTTSEDVAYFWQNSINLQDYDDSDDITTVITLFDQNDSSQTALLANQMMRVVATHTKIDAWDTDDSWAWVSVRPFESETNKRISSEWAWTSQNLPLRPLSGQTRLKVTYPSANVMVTECLVDTSMLDIENYTLVARAETPKAPSCKSSIDWLFDELGKYSEHEMLVALQGIQKGVTLPNGVVCSPTCLVQRKDNLKFIYLYAFGSETLIDGVVATVDDNCCRDEYGALEDCETGFDGIWDDLQAGLTGSDLTTLTPSQVNTYTNNNLLRIKNRLFALTSDQALRWSIMNQLLDVGLLVQRGSVATTTEISGII